MEHMHARWRRKHSFALRANNLTGGRDRRRSGDPTLFRRVLCQLSYSTIGGPAIAEPDGGFHHRLIDGKYRQ